ncbi:unnamed protein product [Caenorhabditis angaria]|uniref:Uncharacterized protein n=1 Tax=Caenorhabditis angaria TaxID=860376 RepID=A0A9P1N1T7_9PELO|nr:unnamed protein product [Caenorhabditis angaria]
MDDGSQESLKFVDSQSDDIEIEREILILERDIRQQKESSLNAKTSITFDQLRKIHTISQYLGALKEPFFDRICRAAEIQRASLKNRLKQNKERFDPPSKLGVFDSQSSLTDSQFTLTPTTIHTLLNTSSSSSCSGSGSIREEPQNDLRFPPNRQFDLLSLGFSYFELRGFLDVFENFKNENPEISSKNQLIPLFSNYVSINSPENLKNIGMAFNLLELGNSVQDLRGLVKFRPNHLDSSDSTIDDDISPPKRRKLSPKIEEEEEEVEESQENQEEDQE